MSNILNQKEDVLKIELTKHGRKLLGMGIFQPVYFSFFDDSVIYDNSYTGIVGEDVNNIQGRILDKSLTFSHFNLVDDVLIAPIGTSDVMSDYSPSWDLFFLNGKVNYLQNSSTYHKKIFNIDDIVYSISLSEPEKEVKIEENYILIDLKELNLSDDMKNFEIELVTFEDIEGGKSAGLEKRLSFHKHKSNIIDGLLYEENELPNNYFEINLTENDASYFFDILVDDEIDTDFIISNKFKQQKLVETAKTNYTSENAPDPCEPCCDTTTEIC